eukprot:CAMPEP_0184678334 /NCGR_PEP_ID=MMETSP0312-20130426/1058_1 /TAXON_ID=31354 /ORGANISM="Compsopogon coeruleus, Strain SAG 36.94" /LENGTH=357 /DNA_ID=CAMNT_0027126999 /DNA_START=332 /DNA_END=1405 /DNA_ORIENTATION=+
MPPHGRNNTSYARQASQALLEEVGTQLLRAETNGPPGYNLNGRGYHQVTAATPPLPQQRYRRTDQHGNMGPRPPLLDHGRRTDDPMNSMNGPRGPLMKPVQHPHHQHDYSIRPRGYAGHPSSAPISPPYHVSHGPHYPSPSARSRFGPMDRSYFGPTADLNDSAPTGAVVPLVSAIQQACGLVETKNTRVFHDAISQFQMDAGPGEETIRADFVSHFLDLLDQFDQRFDDLTARVDRSCDGVVRLAKVPAIQGLEDLVVGEAESPEDAEIQRQLKRKFVDAMEKVQTRPMPKRRRGNLPKEATVVFKKWFDEHLEHPYPSDEEKQEMSRLTGVSVQQITNWYINHRKRVWKPTTSRP